jgi:hypothetical protein
MEGKEQKKRKKQIGVIIEKANSFLFCLSLMRLQPSSHCP